jgi:RNA recognition motif-containing protein
MCCENISRVEGGGTNKAHVQMNTTVFVTNIPFRAEKEDVEALCAQYGAVKNVSLVTDRETGKKRGFGFVEMSTPEEAEALISGLDGMEYMGRDLVAREARQRS